jgi:hypothetical protein
VHDSPPLPPGVSEAEFRFRIAELEWQEHWLPAAKKYVFPKHGSVIDLAHRLKITRRLAADVSEMGFVFDARMGDFLRRSFESIKEIPRLRHRARAGSPESSKSRQAFQKLVICAFAGMAKNEVRCSIQKSFTLRPYPPLKSFWVI